MRQPYSIHIFLYRITDDQPEYLIFKRHPRPDLALPGFWQGISGGVEDDETLQETVIREVWEEAGIRIPEAVPSGFISTYPIRDEWRVHYGEGPSHVKEHCFFFETDEEPKISEEHSEYRWIRFDEASDYLSYGDTLVALASVHRALQ